jgi:P27 family predicted phage terminase small subunit
MAEQPGRPTPPKSLGKAGAELWSQIVSALAEDWQLDNRELAVLLEACRTADEMVPLREAVEAEPITTGSKGQAVVHPAQQELRQLRAVQARLLGSLELADPSTDSITTRRARKAATSRWHGERLRAVR